MGRKLFWILWLLPLVLCAQSAKEVLEKSVRLFSGGDIRFRVEETIVRPGGEQKRTFVVARRERGGEKELLIRFTAPSTLRCTAILTKKRGEKAQTYVYFPSLGRVRIIPPSKENKEAVGLGISYARLHESGGKLLPLKKMRETGHELYRVTRLEKGDKSVYTIDADTLRLLRLDVYEKGRLVKEVVVDEVGEAAGRTLVLAWHIVDQKKRRELRFRVDPASVSTEVKAAWFARNRLRRCRF